MSNSGGIVWPSLACADRFFFCHFPWDLSFPAPAIGCELIASYPSILLGSNAPDDKRLARGPLLEKDQDDRNEGKHGNDEDKLREFAHQSGRRHCDRHRDDRCAAFYCGSDVVANREVGNCDLGVTLHDG